MNNAGVGGGGGQTRDISPNPGRNIRMKHFFLGARNDRQLPLAKDETLSSPEVTQLSSAAT
jgi:hypothetical protein